MCVYPNICGVTDWNLNVWLLALLAKFHAFYLPKKRPLWHLGDFMEGAEKALATHSSTLGWKIPWAEEPGRLQSMGSLRVGLDWATSLSLFTFMHWRRKWQPTPLFLPGESQGRGSLVGCRLWGRTESDTTSDLAAAAWNRKRLHLSYFISCFFLKFLLCIYMYIYCW